MTHLNDKLHIDRFKRATVIGLGLTGYSAVRYLVSQGLLVSVVDAKSKPALAEKLSKEFPQVNTQFGNFDEHEFEDDLLILSPGVPRALASVKNAIKQGKTVAGDIELFLQANEKPVIAITGSNGKSTVTELVGHLCRAGQLQPLVAGNIGRPALDALSDQVDYDVAVLELSSFQLESINSVAAESATILNISEDHMDRYASLGDYILTKAKILKGAKLAVLPRHDALGDQITVSASLRSFDLDEPANDDEYGVVRVSGRRWLMKGKQKLMQVAEVPLVGLHNVKNVLAAFALTEFLAIPIQALSRAVKEFVGLPHRMQTVARANNLTWVNDSKATNVGATATALNSIEKQLIWIAGGQGKGADFSPLRHAMSAKLLRAILVGEDADKIEQAISGSVQIDRAETIYSAVQMAAQIGAEHATESKQEVIVMLSPACASFDMYQNYEKRGEDFSDCVRQVIAGGMR